MAEDKQIVVRKFQGMAIGQRRTDGYLNATAMCNANKKRWPDYWRNDATKEFVKALAATVGIPTVELVQTREGSKGGTWVHPQIAVHLAQWCSPEFAVVATGWILDIVTTGQASINPPAPPIDAAAIGAAVIKAVLPELAGLVEQMVAQRAVQARRADDGVLLLDLVDEYMPDAPRYWKNLAMGRVRHALARNRHGILQRRRRDLLMVDIDHVHIADEAIRKTVHDYMREKEPRVADPRLPGL